VTSSARRTRFAFAALLVLVAVAAATTLLPSVPAHAAKSLGGVAFEPAKGNVETLVSLTTENGCPEGTEYVTAKMSGFGFPGDGQAIVAPTRLLVSEEQPMLLPINDSFFNFAEDRSTPLKGTYTITVRCTDKFAIKSYGDFTASMTWETPGGSLKNLRKATFRAKNTAAIPVDAPVWTGTEDDGVVPDAQPPADAAPGAAPPAAEGAAPDAAPQPSAGAPAPDPAAPPAGEQTATGAAVDEDGVGAVTWIALAVVALAIAGGTWWIAARQRTR
jgi:hypothetical protein